MAAGEKVGVWTIVGILIGVIALGFATIYRSQDIALARMLKMEEDVGAIADLKAELAVVREQVVVLQKTVDALRKPRPFREEPKSE